MGVVRRVTGGVIAGALALVVVGLMLPDEFAVHRSTIIEAPASVVFEQVNNLKRNEAWSPWQADDPSIRIKYEDQVEGPGASYTWTGNTADQGRLTIVSIDPPRLLTTRINFGPQGQGTATWTFEPTETGTLVTWAFAGHAGTLAERYFGLMMDAWVGPDFERGLSRLKLVAEAQPFPPPTAGSPTLDREQG